MPDQVFLTPDFGPRLQAAFAPLAPQLRLDGAKIGPSKAEATVCRADNTCFAVHFALAQQRCADTTAGSWCVRVADSTPAEAAAVLQALTGLQPATVVATEAPAQQGDPGPFAVLLAATMLAPLLVATVWRQSRKHGATLLLGLATAMALTSWLPSVAALRAALHASLDATQDVLFHAKLGGPATSLALWLAIPLVLGVYVAACLRIAHRGRAQSVQALVCLALTGPLLGAAVSLVSGRIGGWDAVSMGCVGSLCALGAGHQRLAGPRQLALALASSGASLLLLEAAVRALLANPPPAAEQDVRLLHARSSRPDGVTVTNMGAAMHALLYDAPATASSIVLRLSKPPANGPWVLHLGDSMVFGFGVRAAETLPEQLALRWPGMAQINASAAGISLDVQLPVAWRLLQPHPPKLVVLHVMPGNDLQELNQPNEACRDEPTLVLEPVPRLRCATPQWRSVSPLARLLRSSAPVPVVLLTRVSWLARLAESATHRLVQRDVRPPLNIPLAAAQYQDLLTALQQRCTEAKTKLVAVVWPLRASVYKQDAAPQRAALLQALHNAGIDTVDTQPVIDTWVQQDGEDSVFLSRPAGDIHLQPQGLRRLAEWLLPQLQAR